MNRIYATYGKREDFLLVGVHGSPEKELISRYCSANKILWLQPYEGGELANRGFLRTTGVRSTPSICLIDKEGKVRRIGGDMNGLEEEVRSLLVSSGAGT